MGLFTREQNTGTIALFSFILLVFSLCFFIGYSNKNNSIPVIKEKTKVLKTKLLLEKSIIKIPEAKTYVFLIKPVEQVLAKPISLVRKYQQI